MSFIEQYLEKFITSIDFLLKQIASSGLSETLDKIPVGLFDLNFHFNVRVKNGNVKDEFILLVTREKSKLSKGYSSAVGFSLIGSEGIWLEIFQGKKSLMAHVIEGNMKVPNIRVNWLKIMLLSNLLSNLVSMKLLKLK